MADRPDEPALSPAEEERVRALLADARHDEPIPSEVAARLDATLEGLTPGGVDSPAVEASPEEPMVVTSLATRRRRRRLSQLLVAAAAVALVGVAGPQLLGAGEDMLSAGGSQDSGAVSVTGDAESGSSGVDQENLGGADSAESGGGTTRAPQAEKAPRPLQLTADDFEQRVADLGSDSSVRSAPEYFVLGDATLTACRGDATWGPGRRVPATYDGQPGVLILRRVEDGERQVDLYLCGELEPERSTTVSVP